MHTQKGYTALHATMNDTADMKLLSLFLQPIRVPIYSVCNAIESKAAYTPQAVHADGGNKSICCSPKTPKRQAYDSRCQCM